MCVCVLCTCMSKPNKPSFVHNCLFVCLFLFSCETRAMNASDMSILNKPMLYRYYCHCVGCCCCSCCAGSPATTQLPFISQHAIITDKATRQANRHKHSCTHHTHTHLLIHYHQTGSHGFHAIHFIRSET